MRNFLHEKCDDEVESLHPNRVQEGKMDDLLDQQNELNEVSFLLQFEDLKLVKASLFYKVF